MKSCIFLMTLLVSQLTFAYSCEERVIFMHLFKIQGLIAQKIKGPDFKDSLKKGIEYCQEEMAPLNVKYKESFLSCTSNKNEPGNDDSLIQEMYSEANNLVVSDEKKFAHSMVEKYRADFDLEKFCREYGRGSPYIKAKMNL